MHGTVTRNSFYTKLGNMYGDSLYSFKPISSIMNTTFLSADYNMSIDKVIKLAMSSPKDSHINNARHLNSLKWLPENLLI